MCQLCFPHICIQDDRATGFMKAAGKTTEQISIPTVIIYKALSLWLASVAHHSWASPIFSSIPFPPVAGSNAPSLSATFMSQLIHFYGVFFIMCSSKMLIVACNQWSIKARIELVAHSHDLYYATN